MYLLFLKKAAPRCTSFALGAHDFEDTILKMAEIKKLTSKYFPPDEVKEILMTAEMQCKIRGNSLPLDQALEEFRKKARVREAMDYLKT